ncbi:hypothetical protein MC45_03270 [Sphingomonas taxi]|uniref:Uncharacterized protein n=2 Tax=Sphingomonas taxi TaxID=1549858 RepID=A0A097EK67_9SPHN|nr:hypothetical protein MC45_03270 [Sphingomonas taxi]
MAADLRQSRWMIGLSVAVGRFVEALFWAILRVAGVITVAVVAVAAAALLAWIVARKLWARQRRKRGS